MDAGFINLTPENLDGEHLCCIIRSKKAHPGVEAKRQWLADRLKEGHIFRKLNAKATVFIEYAPLETAWTPVLGDSYYYIYCLWVCGESKGKGYGRALMEYCLADARAKGKSGVCMLGAEKQKAWLSDQAFAKKFGFQTVDTAPNGYELCAPCEKATDRKQGADGLLRYAVPVYPSARGAGGTVLRGERRAAVPRPGGYAAKGEGAALCFQQLGRILQRKV